MKWKKLALTDELTGVWNYRAFKTFYSQEFYRAKRHNYSLSLVFIDLNEFKKYNDTHGHIEGNQLLKNFTKIIQKELRKYDYMFRYAGDEFILLLPHTLKCTTKNIIYRLAKKIFYKLQMSISYGIAEYPHDSKHRLKLLKFADNQMYKMKGE